MLVPNDTQGYLNVELDIGKGGKLQERVTLKDKLMLPGKWEMGLIEMYYELSNSTYIEPNLIDPASEVYNWSFIFNIRAAEGMSFKKTEFVKYDRQSLCKKWRSTSSSKTTSSEVVMIQHEKIVAKQRARITIGDIIQSFNNQFESVTPVSRKVASRMGVGWNAPPVLSLVKRKVKLTLPPYVESVFIGTALAKLLGFTQLQPFGHSKLSLLFKRVCVYIPSPYTGEVTGKDGKSHDLSKERYRMVYNTESIQSSHDCDCYSEQGKNIFIYCGQLEYRLVGNTATPLLRFSSLTSTRHTIHYEQFQTIQYYPLIQNEIQHFDFRLVDEKGQDIKFFGIKPTLVLHFRKIIEEA